jgi:hypothetical protein
VAKLQSNYSAKEFFLDDFQSTLFPLSTNRLLVEKGAAELQHFADRIISGAGSFLPQQRVYANKDPFHLRRTVKLDPVAEFFLYSLVYRNRARFRKPHNQRRVHFGYRFTQGKPISASKSYADFKAAVWRGTRLRKYDFIGFDVASYFNGVYHHDLRAWFDSLGADQADVEAFGNSSAK